MNRDMPQVIIEKTEDGSYTLYLPEREERYHSVKGALTESQHIFIDMGLKYSGKDRLNVLEIGFGTGLNAFLTLLTAQSLSLFVQYTGIELYPLEETIWKSLKYPELINPDNTEEFELLHTVKWEEMQTITSNFLLHKIHGDFTTYSFPTSHFDVIYFDAFAPDKQSEMWTQPLFDKLYHSLKPEGVITTYCAKGVVRRMLQSAGFTVERLPGPPGGKREILRGIKSHRQ